MPKPLCLRLQAKLTVPFERQQVIIGSIGEGDAVETKIDAVLPLGWLALNLSALNVIQRRGSKWPGNALDVFPASNHMNIGGVVGSASGRNGAVIKESLAECQDLTGACRHQHDVDEFLPSDFTNDVAILLHRPETGLAGMILRR